MVRLPTAPEFRRYGDDQGAVLAAFLAEILSRIADLTSGREMLIYRPRGCMLKSECRKLRRLERLAADFGFWQIERPKPRIRVPARTRFG